MEVRVMTSIDKKGFLFVIWFMVVVELFGFAIDLHSRAYADAAMVTFFVPLIIAFVTTFPKL
jgi:hypothetical protein